MFHCVWFLYSLLHNLSYQWKKEQSTDYEVLGFNGCQLEFISTRKKIFLKIPDDILVKTFLVMTADGRKNMEY